MMIAIFLLPLCRSEDGAWYSPVTKSIPRAKSAIHSMTAIDLCQLPADAGTCNRELIRYFYDFNDDECKRFTFTGCGGNSNRFMRRSHCRSRCVKDKEKLHVKHIGSFSAKNQTLSSNTKEEAIRRQNFTKTTKDYVQSSTTTKSIKSTTLVPILRSVKKVNSITSSITAQCLYCDPIFGRCLNGVCGCLDGFRKLGKICVDVNECEDSTICPNNSRCINTIGSYHCACTIGSNIEKSCKIETGHNGYQEKLKVTPFGAIVLTTRSPLRDVVSITKKQDDRCIKEFNELLRLECFDASWVEKFFWNSDIKECQSFWYDLSCDPNSLKDSNVFDSLEACHALCSGNIDFNTILPVTKTVSTQWTSTQSSPRFPFTSTEENQLRSSYFKITGSNKFDRLAYMEAFRLKLNALGISLSHLDGTTISTPFEGSSLAFSGSGAGKEKTTIFVSTESSLKTTRKKIEEKQAIVSNEDDSKNELSRKNYNEQGNSENTITNAAVLFRNIDTTPVTEGKNEIESTTEMKDSSQGEISRLDLCDEALHPGLEEDCKNETWELKWYFNVEKGACKSFWYGGCETEAKNVFGDVKSCKTTCGHKYPAQNEYMRPVPFENLERTTSTLNSQLLVFPTTILPKEKPLRGNNYYDIDKQSTNSRKLLSYTTFSPYTEETITPPDEKISEINQVVNLEQNYEETLMETSTSTITTNINIPYPDETKKYMSKNTYEEKSVSMHIFPDKSVTVTTLKTDTNQAYMAEDVCDKGYDPKWDEDCSGDNWVVKSYFEPNVQGCKRIWWGGCKTSNNNLWMDQKECQAACQHKMKLQQSYTYIPRSVSKILPNESKGQTRNDRNLPVIHTDDVSENSINRTEDFALRFPKHLNFIPDEEDNTPYSSTGTSTKIKIQFRATLGIKHTTSEKYETIRNTITATTSPNVFARSVKLTSDSEPRTEQETEPQNINVLADAPMLYVTEEPNSLLIKSLDEETSMTSFPSQANIINKKLPRKEDQVKKDDSTYSNLFHHPITPASQCLEFFDSNLTSSNNEENSWTTRYYYDQDLRACRMFWSNGYMSLSKNNFLDLETCQWMCEGTHPDPKGRSCLDDFDRKYLDDCAHGVFSFRYYFDHHRKKCASLHWGGCQSDSKNFFIDMGQCQELCEKPNRELANGCIEPFDHRYLDSCSPDGRFQQYYFFNLTTQSCEMFWFGNCKGSGQNIFPSLETCRWMCERKKEDRIPQHCSDKFDPKYMESCNDGQWVEKWYFQHEKGECVSFWWDGCVSPSQNIFPDEGSCSKYCIHSGDPFSAELDRPDAMYACLEPKQIGTCIETYPAFYYDRLSRRCQPFAYSGCGGNANRFLTLSQCEELCSPFVDMLDSELDCYLPLHTGYGKNEPDCIQHADYRFYFDTNHGRCLTFWYLGCGGNANNFYTYEVCERTCKGEKLKAERIPRHSTHVCFRPPGDRGNCVGNSSSSLQRWTYTSQRCNKFIYSGCGGNENRFLTLMDCERTCKGLNPSSNPELCAHEPDWGPCNQLRYMWFYNQSRGTCDQFLYGGCGGNSNKFKSFEICQKSCEISGLDPCMEALDRGNWCEAMSNRYYFNKRAKQCKGFHYTGCGKSGNNFLTKEECYNKCEKRYARTSRMILSQTQSQNRTKGKKGKIQIKPIGYSGVKPPVKTDMLRHITLNYNKTYHKSEPEWIDYALCSGYRYNISGHYTTLTSYFCSTSGQADCLTEIISPTNGEEFCKIQRPFLRGTHLYSWYFEMGTKV